MGNREVGSHQEPEWREVRNLAVKAITPKKDVNYFTLYNMYNNVYIFLLCRLKINQVKELQNLCLFSPDSMVANRRAVAEK